MNLQDLDFYNNLVKKKKRMKSKKRGSSCVGRRHSCKRKYGCRLVRTKRGIHCRRLHTRKNKQIK